MEGEEQFRRDWLSEHPDYARRLANIRRELLRYERPDDAYLLDRLDQIETRRPEPRDAGMALG